ncbi:hypothetical protein QBC35DRAFT_45161 [Podospora australis]|uniref:Uncharacterized protein n=1 Tax=Podospora australis TaxID=1536484 RepID=A0AAN6X0D8_9PEZI|nr:hypothetical protein QBC35DRAFT_45161 [Podospora australis]
MHPNQSSTRLTSFLHNHRTNHILNPDLNRLPDTNPYGFPNGCSQHICGPFRYSERDSTSSLSSIPDPVFDSSSSEATSCSWKRSTFATKETEATQVTSSHKQAKASIFSDITTDSHYTCSERRQLVEDLPVDQPRRIADFPGDGPRVNEQPDPRSDHVDIEHGVEPFPQDLLHILNNLSTSHDHLDNNGMISAGPDPIKDDFWAWDQARQRYIHTDRETGKELVCPEFFD